MWRSLQRSFIIALIGAMAGVVANALRRDTDSHGNHRHIPLIAPTIPPISSKDIVSFEEARRLWEAGATVFLDARPSSQYAEGHIANALSLPADKFNEAFSQVASFVSPDSIVVVYCDGKECDLSHEVQRRLRELGFGNVRVLVNGWTTWKAAGLLTSRGQQP